jgi:FkbM family methyltransferase
VNQFTVFANRVVRKLNSLVESISYPTDVLRFRDCFETVRSVLKYIQPGIIFDIGAHKGDWTFVLARLCSGLARSVMFEPHPLFLPFLDRLAIPGVTKSIMPFGLGSSDQEIDIHSDTASASFLNALGAQNAFFPDSFHAAKIERSSVKVLDEVVVSHHLPFPDVVKIDVQGFELEVLKGARTVLAETDILVIELSYTQFYKGQPALWEIEQFLNDHHFFMVDHGFELRSSSGQLLQTDGIFANQKKRPTLS